MNINKKINKVKIQNSHKFQLTQVKNHLEFKKTRLKNKLILVRKIHKLIVNKTNLFILF